MAAPSSVSASGLATVTTTASYYTFDAAVQRCIVAVNGDSADILFGRWNAAASATEWDFEILVGQVVVSPPGWLIEKVSMRAATATANYETEFTVRGFA